MSATSWFIAGLLAGAALMLGTVLLWRLSREATLRSRRVLLAGGLTAAGIAAVAAGLSLALSAAPQTTPAPDDLALSASPPALAPSPASAPTRAASATAMSASAAMPPASMMAQILSTSGGARPGTAQPMDQAAAELAARLERQGGSAADWNLLAQAYDFLGRPQDARRARARAAKAGATQPTR
jgi:hypothetical protein